MPPYASPNSFSESSRKTKTIFYLDVVVVMVVAWLAI